MKVHGWCTRCHKVKRVTVSSQGMALLAAKRVPVGICAQCEEDKEYERQVRGFTR